MMAIESVFWLAVVGLFYVYVGYPVTICALARLTSKRALKASHEPTLSIIIAAYNEEAAIRATLENKLALHYPPAKRQIIVVSDGSTDRTDAIVQEFVSRGVVYIRQSPRNGKTAAINLAVTRATGELLVFADANSLYDPTALRELAGNFADAQVGYVTGKLRYLNPDGSMTGDGCSAYMRYENFIRTCESAIGSLVGVNGGIDAVLGRLYEPMHADDLPDMVLPLNVVARGYRVVYEPEALLSEVSNANPRDEYRMRVRVALRSLWTLRDKAHLLAVWRYGFYSIQLFSHKVLRYLAFVMLILTFVTSMAAWNAWWVYRVALVLQVVFWTAAFLGYRAALHGQPNRLLAIPYYFMLVNAASLQACVKFVQGQRHRVWSPRLG